MIFIDWWKFISKNNLSKGKGELLLLSEINFEFIILLINESIFINLVTSKTIFQVALQFV